MKRYKTYFADYAHADHRTCTGTVIQTACGGCRKTGQITDIMRC